MYLLQREFKYRRHLYPFIKRTGRLKIASNFVDTKYIIVEFSKLTTARPILGYIQNKLSSEIQM